MPVSRKGRVQVDSRIHNPEKRSYEAQHVTHIDPQRKESGAANYERLAASLGQFNSALGTFASGVKKYEKNAEIRAKKLEAEREAAQRRSARSSGGGGRRSGGKKDTGVGDPFMPDVTTDKDGKPIVIQGDPGFQGRVLGEENATVKTYKEAIDVKRGIGADFDMNFQQQSAMDKENGYKIDVTDPKTGEPTGEKRMMTLQELQMRHAQIDKSIVDKYGDQPLVVKHLRERNKWHAFDAKKDLIAAEAKDRENTATEFVSTSAMDRLKQLQAQNLTPDQIAQQLQQQNVADAKVISPYFSREDSDKAVLGAVNDSLKDGDPESARAAVALIQGSPDRKSGVTSYLKHPKYAKIAHGILTKSSKIIAQADAENEASLASKAYLNAVIKNEDTPLIQDIKVEVNGQKVEISRSDQLKAISLQLDEKIVSQFNMDKDPAKAIPALVEAYQDTPELSSPTLKKMVAGYTLKKGEQVDFRDPAFQQANTVALTMLRAGPGGKTQLRKLVPDYMVPFYEMGNLLDRAGIRDPEVVQNRLNTYLENRSRGGSMGWPEAVKSDMKDFKIPGLSRAQENMVMTLTKMSVLDEDLTAEDIKGRANKIAEDVKRLNPTMNGRTYSIPHDSVLPAEHFQKNAEKALGYLGKNLGFDSEKAYLKRVGNSYVIYDSETETLHTDETGRPYAIAFDKIVGMGKAGLLTKAEKDEAERKKAQEASKAQIKDSRLRHKAGGFWGSVGRVFNGETLDDAAERVSQAQLHAEKNELGMIMEDFGRTDDYEGYKKSKHEKSKAQADAQTYDPNIEEGL